MYNCFVSKACICGLNCLMRRQRVSPFTSVFGKREENVMDVLVKQLIELYHLGSREKIRSGAYYTSNFFQDYWLDVTLVVACPVIF